MKQKNSLNHDSPDLYDSYDSKNQANQHNPINQGSDNMKQGWEIKKLGEIYSFKNGINFDKTQKNGNGVLTLDVLNMYCDGLKVNVVNLYKIDKQISEDYKLKNGDILIVRSSVKEEGVAWATYFEEGDEPITFCGFIIRGRPISKVNAEYIVYYLRSHAVRKELIKKSVKSTITNINQAILSEIKIPLPPLPEQQRIVAILDEAFAAIAKAKANAEQNLKNAKELFESYLQGVFENGNWETKTIQEVTKVINGYAFASKDFKSTNTIKSIKITNVGVKEFVEEVDNYLPEKFKDTLKEVQVKEGNIVIALTRTIISAGLKVAVVPASYNGALVNQRVAALVPNEKIINQRYLYNFLTTDGVAKYVLAHVNTLMQPNLSINDLKNLPVPSPSLKEQIEIVSKLDGLRNETKKLETIYQQKINDLEELKKSVLQKAFSGGLNYDLKND